MILQTVLIALALSVGSLPLLAQNPLVEIYVDDANSTYPLGVQIIRDGGIDIRALRIYASSPTQILSFNTDMPNVLPYPLWESGMGVFSRDSSTLPTEKALVHFMTDNATLEQTFRIDFLDATYSVVWQQNTTLSIDPSLLVAAPCNRKVLDLRTGVDSTEKHLEPGARDPNWNVFCESNPIPAFVVDPIWAAVQNEAWISVSSNSDAEAGDYSFCRTFYASDKCQLFFDLYLSADDTVAAVVFNGVSYPVHELYTWSVCHFSFTATANPGANILQLSVTNMGGPTSLILWERSQVHILSGEAAISTHSEGKCCTALNDITAGNDKAICTGDDVELSVNKGQQGVIYEWKKEQGGLVGAGEKIRVSPEQSTRYILHSTLNNCETWDTVAVRVNPLPQFSVQDVVACQGESKELSISNSQPTTLYEWRDEKGKLVGRGEKVVVTPVQRTVYRIIAQSPEGCTSQQSLTVDIDRVHVVVSVSDSLEAKANTPVEVVVYAQAGRNILLNNLSYTIHITDGIFWTEGATYANQEAMISQSKTNVSLGTSPQEIGRIKGIALATPSQTGKIYLSDITSDVNTTCIEIATTKGKLSAEPVCASNQRTISIAGNLLVLSPNPSNGELRLQSDYRIEEVSVMNSLGQEIYNNILPQAGQDSHLRIEASGLYLVRAKIDGFWVVRSVLVQR